MEYERRFRLDRVPEGMSGPSELIRQAYWTLGDGWILRVRRTGEDDNTAGTEVAIKGPRSGFQRAEFEFFLAQAKGMPSVSEVKNATDDLFRASGGHIVVKTRTSYLASDGLAWDIDVFHFDNEGLVIAEIELPSALGVAAISKPEWAAEDVSENRSYDNDTLAFRPWNRRKSL
ncbi:hypothetical protein [Nocardioides humi]|uniref:CYTH domain-containing protein n=1 Tax=Nocardioides humi TaxID=449461 RepID=A0ABN2A0D4_9ACTN|nr:hypothetical protein [Nocardioides humi]